MKIFIFIKEINNKIINIIEFAIINVHLNELIKSKLVTAIIKIKVHIINYLIINLLMKIDVIKFKKMTFNLRDEKLIINSY